MFIDALKKGDIQLASMYYELSVQPKGFEELKEELQKEGNLEQSIKYFTEVRGGEKKCVKPGEYGGCVFEYVYLTDKDIKSPITGTDNHLFISKGSKRIKSTSFIENKFTHLWKITQPY